MDVATPRSFMHIFIVIFLFTDGIIIDAAYITCLFSLGFVQYYYSSPTTSV